MSAGSTDLRFDAPSIDFERRDAGIDAIISAAKAGMPKGTMDVLGDLVFCEAIDPSDRQGGLQIRSNPIGASGFEYRHSLPRLDDGVRDVAPIAAAIVDGAVKVARIAPGLVDLAIEMRDGAKTIMDATASGLRPMRFEGLGISIGAGVDGVAYVLDVSMLSHDLSLAPHRVAARSLQGAEDHLLRLVSLHIKRRTAMAQAMAAGGTGWLDDAARLIMEGAGMDLPSLAARMRGGREIVFDFSGEGGAEYAGGLRWEDGMIVGYVARDDGDVTFRFDADTLRLVDAHLPTTVTSSLVGRRLRDVVDLPFIPPLSVIVDASEAGRVLDLKLVISRSPVYPAKPAFIACSERTL